MTIYVFLGPTLPVADARAVLDAVYLPPVSQGDVCRVARRASAIGIVDGYFHSVPAVWHKEILWALAQGVRVYGASSMGALRAAELAAFGMQGVGWIFEAFHSGALDDDDEVAIVHARGEEPEGQGGYRAMSEPMVNIRRTLAAAAGAGIISEETAEQLLGIAKRLHYAERSYPRLLRDAAGSVPGEPLERLAAWLPGNRVDQKRDDALAMLRRIADEQRDAGPPTHKFRFHATELWQRLLHRVQAEGSPGAGHARPEEARPEAEIDEQALRRWLLLEVAKSQHIEPSAEALRETILDFRRRAELWEPEQLSAWLDHNQLTIAEFAAIMEDEARIRGMLDWVQIEAERLRPHVQKLALLRPPA